jgi:hypothetical protein
MMKKLTLLLTAILIGIGPLYIYQNSSCQRPLPWQKEACQEIEAKILGATVRITFHGEIEIENGYEIETVFGTISHATVVDGRYLLTHNHFGIPLSQVQLYNRYANGGFRGMSIDRLDGTAVLEYAPLDVFVVVEEKGETVLLDFGTVAGVGFFTSAGLNSAEVAYYDPTMLVPGVEVAQVDWERQGNTRIEWSQIIDVYSKDGLPLALVDNFIEKGSSGGGLFLNGQLIGNNWAQIPGSNSSTAGSGQGSSLVALNIGFDEVPDDSLQLTKSVLIATVSARNHLWMGI